jgi:hypothetical protein
MSCPRIEFKKFFGRGIELENCIDEIARLVRGKCPDLNERELGHCFHKLFDIRTHGSLQDRFQQEYSRGRAKRRGE